MNPDTEFYRGKRDMQEVDPHDLAALQAVMRSAETIGGEYLAGVHEALLDMSVANIRSFLSHLSIPERGQFNLLVGDLMRRFKE